MLAVEMRNITKRFGSFTANDQINFLVEKGGDTLSAWRKRCGENNSHEYTVWFI